MTDRPDDGALVTQYPSLELCVQFSDDGKNIRKYSRLPFEGGECLYSHPASPAQVAQVANDGAKLASEGTFANPSLFGKPTFALSVPFAASPAQVASAPDRAGVEALRSRVLDMPFANTAPIEWSDEEWQRLAALSATPSREGES